MAWVLSYALEGPLTSYVERRVNAALKGYTASLGRAHFNPFKLSVTLNDVALVQEANPDPPVAESSRIWANVEWSSLIWGRLVAKFDFDAPKLYVNRNHFEKELGDPTPVAERGWQEALLAVYPFKINLLRITDGRVTYVERGGTKPLELSALAIEARNMRNVRSREREYPSKIFVEATVFDQGRAVLRGNADLLAEPHATFKGEVRLAAITLEYFAPILERYHVAVRGGTLSAESRVEYAAEFQDVELRTLEVTSLDADYTYRAAGPKPERVAVKTAKEAAEQIANEPETRVRAERIHVTGAIGLVNQSAPQPYRVYFSDVDLVVENFSNHFSEGPATAHGTAQFLGSGRTAISGTFRPEDNGPDFDLFVRIEDTDMRQMNDILRAHGKFDVARGLFSLYSELRVRNRQVTGYMKPLFRDVQVYERRQDVEKSALRKLYEKIVGGLSTLLENRTPREEVATKASIHGRREGDTMLSTGQAILNVIRNAFFDAILPGFDAQTGARGRGEGTRDRSARR